MRAIRTRHLICGCEWVATGKRDEFGLIIGVVGRCDLGAVMTAAAQHVVVWFLQLASKRPCPIKSMPR